MWSAPSGAWTGRRSEDRREIHSNSNSDSNSNSNSNSKVSNNNNSTSPRTDGNLKKVFLGDAMVKGSLEIKGPWWRVKLKKVLFGIPEPCCAAWSCNLGSNSIFEFDP